MARNYKVYGCAHDASGSLDVTLTVGGNEVYNGAITADTEPHNEDPLTITEIFSFNVDDALTGNQNWSVSVNGTTDTAELHLSNLECNNVRPNMVIPLEYLVDKVNALDDQFNDGFTAEEQLYIDTQLGADLPADVRARLQAGTSTPATDSLAVTTANEQEGLDAEVYYAVSARATNVEIDGEAFATAEGATVPVGDGETATLVWNMTPEVFAYYPPHND